MGRRAAAVFTEEIRRKPGLISTALLGSTLIAIGAGLAKSAEATACNSLISARLGGAFGCTGQTNAQARDIYYNPRTSGGGSGDLISFFLPTCETPGGCLPEEELKCMDGSRTMYYVDPARDPLNNPQDPISNGWVFFVTGGESCMDGQQCGNKYRSPERSEMTSVGAPRFRSEKGIFGSPPATQNLFDNYNRVYLRKCTYDRFTGANTHDAEPSPFNANDTVRIFTHGRRMWSAVFNDLAYGYGVVPGKGWYVGGAACSTPKCDGSCPAGGCDGQLPTLNHATKILLVGWSGGGTGMIQQLDSLKAELQSIAPDADIRGVIDARFVPGLEVQASFWLDEFDPTDPNATDDGINDYTQCGAVPSPNCIDANGNGRIEYAEARTSPYDLYDQIWNDPGQLPLSFGCGVGMGCGIAHDYDPSAFDPMSQMAQSYAYHGTVLDQSCLNAHPANPDICNDYMHVLANHVATPFMLRAGTADAEFTGAGSRALGAVDPNYSYRSRAFEHRVRMQAESFIDGFQNRGGPGPFSELATGVDPSWAGNAAPHPMAVFIPDTRVHAGMVRRNSTFFRDCLAPPGGGPALSLHDALYDWITFDAEILAFDSSLPGDWTTTPACP